MKEEGGAPLPGALDFFGTKRKEKEPPVKRRKRVVSSEAQLSDESEDSEDQNEGGDDEGPTETNEGRLDDEQPAALPLSGKVRCFAIR